MKRFLLFHILYWFPPFVTGLSSHTSRRSYIEKLLLATSSPSLFATVLLSNNDIALAVGDEENNKSQEDKQRPFQTAGFPKKEYTNSIVASRDTNISPLEVYDTIQGKLRRNKDQENARALDVGAGAGVSTQVIYEKLGYTNIDAVDWSGTAWELNVVEEGYCPPSVTFYELDDERFLSLWHEKGLEKYDIIAFNFAVNRDKALQFCQQLLKPNGILLAPINTQKDYWLKQTYQLLDADGRVTWSANDVGAWSVQFQPDVTSDTCQGIWCAPFNGFQKLRVYN